MSLAENSISRTVQDFAEAAIDPSKWVTAMSSLSDQIGAVCCALELTDLNTGQAVMECSIDLDSNVLRHYQERIFHINPRVKTASSMAVGRIADDRYLMPNDDRNKDEFLDWLESTPYYFIKGGKILEAGGHIGFFSANYSKQHGPSDPDNDGGFKLLFPHLINFIEVGRVLSNHSLLNSRVDPGTFEQNRPFALLDKAGRLVECSASFESILRSRQILGFRDRKMVAIHAQHRRIVERFLQSAISPERLVEPPLPIRLTSPRNPHGLILRALPIAPNNDVFDVFRPAALVTITDLDQPFRARRAELVALFGLTKREADVAATLCETHTIERAASLLSISEHTIKQHLKAVFQKMGVTRQSELIALASKFSSPR